MQSYSTETVDSVKNLSKCPQGKINELKTHLEPRWQSTKDVIKKLNNGRFWSKVTVFSASIAAIITIAAIILPIPMLLLFPLFVTPFFAAKTLITTYTIDTEIDKLKSNIETLKSEITKLET